MGKDEIQQALVVWHFQHEVLRQCGFTLRAFQELDTNVHHYRNILEERWPYEHKYDEGIVEESEEHYIELTRQLQEEREAEPLIQEHGAAIWFHIQNILVSGANLSKLLWSGKKESSFLQSIKRELRTSLSVNGSSPLRSRQLRNHFEHFDERLGSWAGSAARDMFIDSVILPEAIKSFNPESVFRHYDPQSKILSFQGESYHLQPVLAAVQTLSKEAAAKVAENPLTRFGFVSSDDSS